VLIPDSSVSRYHAKILLSDAGYALVDLGSVNGTFVNGEQVQACLLRNGDQIRLGHSPELINFEDARGLAADSVDDASSMTSSDALRGISDELPGILRAELRKSFIQHFVVESELRLAQEIQRALVPQRLPAVEGYRISGCCEPAHRVGGDFYDFRALPSGGAMAFLGDVAGKGVSASLLSSMVLGCLDAQLRSREDLESALTTLNSILCEKEPGRFVTLFLLRFDANGRCCYASAGHNTAYVYRADEAGIDELPSNSLVAGVLPECSFVSDDLELRSGDVLLAYSDGLTEAENPKGDMLGETVVRGALCEHASKGAESLKEALLSLVLSFTGGEKQSDDITFFIIEKL
jgi:sigma-B regulation protein RsbU (phosphoserine phosphatase)